MQVAEKSKAWSTSGLVRDQIDPDAGFSVALYDSAEAMHAFWNSPKREQATTRQSIALGRVPGTRSWIARALRASRGCWSSAKIRTVVGGCLESDHPVGRRGGPCSEGQERPRAHFTRVAPAARRARRCGEETWQDRSRASPFSNTHPV